MNTPEKQGNDIFCVTCGEPWGVPSREGRQIETGRKTCPSCERLVYVRPCELLNALRDLVIEARECASHSPYPAVRGRMSTAVAQAEAVIQNTVWKIQGLR